MTKQGGWPATGFAARLRAVREQAGLSQRQLAERAGCNVFTLSKLVVRCSWTVMVIRILRTHQEDFYDPCEQN